MERSGLVFVSALFAFHSWMIGLHGQIGDLSLSIDGRRLAQGSTHDVTEGLHNIACSRSKTQHHLYLGDFDVIWNRKRLNIISSSFKDNANSSLWTRRSATVVYLTRTNVNDGRKPLFCKVTRGPYAATARVILRVVVYTPVVGLQCPAQWLLGRELTMHCEIGMVAHSSPNATKLCGGETIRLTNAHFTHLTPEYSIACQSTSDTCEFQPGTPDTCGCSNRSSKATSPTVMTYTLTPNSSSGGTWGCLASFQCGDPGSSTIANIIPLTYNDFEEPQCSNRTVGGWVFTEYTVCAL